MEEADSADAQAPATYHRSQEIRWRRADLNRKRTRPGGARPPEHESPPEHSVLSTRTAVPAIILENHPRGRHPLIRAQYKRDRMVRERRVAVDPESRAERRVQNRAKGHETPQRLRWEAIDGVQPVGYVDDLADEYRRCAFTVAPIFEGAGTKIKVLESLAFGRACLTTPCGARRMDQQPPCPTMAS